MQISPDRAVIPITIESDASSSAAAGAQNARRTQAVVSALRALGAGAQDIITEAYTVQPQWEYLPSKPPRRTGFRASMQVQLKISDLQRLGTWIDAALAAGASGIGNIQFDSTPMQSARQQALTLAVQHAQSDATALALAAGGALGMLLELSTQQSQLQPGLSTVVVSAARREAPETRFQTSLLQVRALVLARWAFIVSPR